MKPAVVVSAVFLMLVAFLHLLRLVFAVGITVGGTAVPMWASVLACVVPGGLAVWLWRSRR
ncbi:MAG: hypothetical protein C0395_09250 [Gemmatimonas sp.]|nr:hypothetical protein [Gemmatimonas sp.]